MYKFRLKCHWSLFLRVQSKYSSIGSDNDLAPTRQQPLSEPIMVRLPTDICITRPQWIKPCIFIDFFSSALLCLHISNHTALFYWLDIMLIRTMAPYSFNPLRHIDAIWRHRTGLILAQVIACCLKTPSHFLNQCHRWGLVAYLSSREFHP